MSGVPEEISQGGPLRGASPLHDLPCKEEDPPEKPEEQCDEIFVVLGEALSEDDDGEKEIAVQRRCYFCWGVFLLVLVVLLSQYYFNRLHTVY